MTGMGGARFLLGSRGWACPAWEEAFYPGDLPPKWRLAYYAHYFDCVLIPEETWRTAPPARIEGWLADTPARFRFLLGIGSTANAGRFPIVERLGGRFAAWIEDDAALRSTGPPTPVWLDSGGGLRALARRLETLRAGAGEVFLIDREGDLGRLRQAATLLEIMGLSEPRHLD
jgi:uncharacterized protein DUF72